MIDAVVFAGLPIEERYRILRRRSDLQDAILAKLYREQDRAFGWSTGSEDASAFREETMEQAPRDLQALGIDLPFTRWRKAVNELHRDKQVEMLELELHFRRLAIWIRTKICWEQRGSPGWEPTHIDLNEAELQLGYTAAGIGKELEALERKRTGRGR